MPGAEDNGGRRAPLPLALWVGYWLPYSQTFIHDQVMHQKRFRATVFAHRRGPHASRFPYEPIVTLDPLERIPYFALRRAPTYARELRVLDPKVVHAHFGFHGVYAAAFAHAADLPLVVTFHGKDGAALLPQARRKPQNILYQAIAPQMLDQARLLLCASTDQADILRGRGVPEDKIRIHRLGVDLGKFEIVERGEGPARLLMVGRFVEKKGMAYGLRAMADVLLEHPDLTMHIVGDGPLAPQLRELVRELGLDRAVTFRGILTSEEVRREMSEADVMITPSVVGRDGDRESGVIVIKEAAACGVPTIGTHHGGIPEIIDHEETGFLVPEHDHEAIARHLRDLVADPKLRRDMGTRARAKMEDEYDTVKQNQRLEDALASVM